MSKCFPLFCFFLSPLFLWRTKLDVTIYDCQMRHISALIETIDSDVCNKCQTLRVTMVSEDIYVESGVKT